MKEKTPEEILDILSKQRFADWYNHGDFDSWIRDEEHALPKEEILKQIKKWFFK